VSDELVLVVPRDLVMDASGWRGIASTGAAARLAVIDAEGRFEPRATMERDPRFKQVIPYLVLRDRGRLFLMRRTRAGGDERLHDRYSIGVGGHLNPGDRDLAGGLTREWTEELAADFVPEFRLLGLLNDDETEVGRVHLGVVYVAEAAGRAVRVRETDKLEGDFAEPAAVRAVYDRLETWSQLVLDALGS
jgi:predicted NUDIX family phosphoesterase